MLNGESELICRLMITLRDLFLPVPPLTTLLDGAPLSRIRQNQRQQIAQQPT